MGNFKLKNILVDFTPKKGVLHYTFLSDFFPQRSKNNLFCVSFSYSARAMKINRCSHSLGMKDITNGANQTAAPYWVHHVHFWIWTSFLGKSPTQGHGIKDHHCLLFLNVLCSVQTPYTYLLIVTFFIKTLLKSGATFIAFYMKKY